MGAARGELVVSQVAPKRFAAIVTTGQRRL